MILCSLLIATTNIKAAGGVTFWEISKLTDTERGDAKGISVSETGIIKLAPSFTEIFNTDQPLIFSTTTDRSGNIYLGTGHDGRIYKIDSTGKGSLFYDSAELDVTALATDSAGNLYAATSPDGKVYRINQKGEANTFFDPEDKYIWSLAFDNTGNLYVGTGDKGILYRVDKQGKGEVYLKTNEKHIISLAYNGGDSLIAGTDPGGLVLKISLGGKEGKVFALLDSPLREIHQLIFGSDGSIYALAVSAQASTDSSKSTSSSSSTTSSSSDGSVTIVATFDDDEDSTPAATPAVQSTSVSGAKSIVHRIYPDGTSEAVWNSRDSIAFAILLDKNNQILIGTATKGRIYSVEQKSRTTTLLLQSTEEQTSNLLSVGNNFYATSNNSGKLFRIGTEPVKEGFYTSPVQDTKFSAVWGRISWRGTGAVELQTRTGNTESPDETWSDWSEAYTTAEGQQVKSPAARFIQWRARLQNTATLSAVKLAYLARNVAPQVNQVTILQAGIGLQEIPQQPVDPGILSAGFDPVIFGIPTNLQPRKVFQKGARSIQWQAEDRNADPLLYSIDYRLVGEQQWRLLVKDLKNNYFTLDADALPDGSYQFRITASDLQVNPLDRTLTGELISDVVEIDNSPPNIEAGQADVKGRNVEIVFAVKDNLSILKRAEYSINGNTWQTIFPEDAIADSRSESYRLKLELAPGDYNIAFRCYDDSANAASTKVLVKVK
ncbi:MAG: hypothetical protein JNN15_07355 [Blastocatellia bacterium]|nr:hypothetical protein [Blastocatellia bacterium]